MNLVAFQDCHQLRALRVADVRVTIDLKKLSTRSRNRAIKYLREGWIRTTTKSGVGLLLKTLLGNNAPWMLYGIEKYNYLAWFSNGPIPTDIWEQLRRIADADTVAAKLAGLAPDGSSVVGHKFLMLKLEQHVPEILAAYVNSPKYIAAVQPVIDMLERGEKFKVQVREPRWNGEQQV